MNTKLLEHCYKAFYASQILLFIRRVGEKIQPKDTSMLPKYVIGAFTEGIRENLFVVIGVANHRAVAEELCLRANKSNWTFDIMQLNGGFYTRYTRNYNTNPRHTYEARSIYDSDAKNHINKIDEILNNECSSFELTRKGAAAVRSYRGR